MTHKVPPFDIDWTQQYPILKIHLPFPCVITTEPVASPTNARLLEAVMFLKKNDALKDIETGLFPEPEYDSPYPPYTNKTPVFSTDVEGEKDEDEDEDEDEDGDEDDEAPPAPHCLMYCARASDQPAPTEKLLYFTSERQMLQAWERLPSIYTEGCWNAEKSSYQSLEKLWGVLPSRFSRKSGSYEVKEEWPDPYAKMYLAYVSVTTKTIDAGYDCRASAALAREHHLPALVAQMFDSFAKAQDEKELPQRVGVLSAEKMLAEWREKQLASNKETT